MSKEIEEYNNILKDYLNKELPSFFKEIDFHLSNTKERICLNWRNGPCVDRVIQELEKSSFPWQKISFKRDIEKYNIKTKASFSFSADEADMIDIILPFKFGYQEHLKDIGICLEFYISKRYRLQEPKDILNSIEEFKKRRIYFIEEFSNCLITKGTLSMSIDEVLNMAIERFYENDIYKSKFNLTDTINEILDNRATPIQKPKYRTGI